MQATTINSLLLTRIEAAEYLGVKPQTLAVWAHHDKGPKFAKKGNWVRYRLSDLEEWVARQVVDTSR